MEAIWAGSSSFSSGNTPYGFYDSDTEFSGSGNHSVDKFSDQVGGDWYKKLKIQPLEYSMANGFNACQTHANKYISRYNLKWKDKKNQIKDLKKAKHVIDMQIEGVSLLRTKRNDFKVVLDNQGIDGLIMTLESYNQLPDLKIPGE